MYKKILGNIWSFVLVIKENLDLFLCVSQQKNYLMSSDKVIKLFLPVKLFLHQLILQIELQWKQNSNKKVYAYSKIFTPLGIWHEKTIMILSQKPRHGGLRDLWSCRKIL